MILYTKIDSENDSECNKMNI